MKNCVLLLLICCYGNGVFAQTGQNQEELMNIYFNKGYEKTYIDKDSAYFYMRKAEDIAHVLNDYEARLDILSYHLGVSDYHFDLSKSAKILKTTDSLLASNVVKDSLTDYADYYDQFLLNQGNYYYKLGANEKAKTYFLEMRSNFASKSLANLTEEDAKELFSNNNFLGGIYKRTGKYDISEQYYLNNRSLVAANEHLYQQKEAFLVNVNQLLAQLYVETNEPLKANPLFIEAVDTYKTFYKKNKKFKNNLVNVFQRISENYIAQDSLKKALSYLDESQKYLLPEDPFFKYSFLLYGDIATKRSQAQKALKYYQNGLLAYQEYRENRPHQDIAKVFGKISKLHLEQNEYQKGLHAIQEALKWSGNSIELRSIDDNPKPGQTFSNRQLLSLLNTKSKLQFLGYEQTDDIAYLNAAIETNIVILETFDLLKKEFDSKLDKQFLAQTAYPIFHHMLATTFVAYQMKKSKPLLELAANISEKNKDFLLLEALRSINATKYGSIPEAFLNREEQFRAEISHLEKKQFVTNNAMQEYQEPLFHLKESYYAFLDTLKLNYPKYHQLKYATIPINLEAIRQNIISTDETLISYTMTADFLYAIAISESNESFYKLPFDKVDKEMITAFYKLISKPSLVNKDQEIKTIGKNLFDKILKGPLAHFNTKKITIISDDLLHYLPFDMLQNENGYLLHDKVIGYGNSITSLLELMPNRNSEASRALAFAPSFNTAASQNQERNFGNLLYNDDEVQEVNTYFETAIYTDSIATLQNFRRMAPEANIIHLATHAYANDEFPDYSYLAFSQNDDEEYVLYIKDLYNAEINADMVALSACQTGIGKLQKGQGMLSLSKGFYYAGAKSLVNTLWKINDKSTVSLVSFFYRELSEGKSKKEALRTAKLKYLESTDDALLKHPYYWAAFTVSGNTSPLQNTPTKWWWLLILPLCIFGFWYLFRKNQSN